MLMKNLLKKILPPLLIDIKKILFKRKYGWFGNYNTWKEAEKASVGYDSEAILTKVNNALLKVKNKEAAYERDGVLFDKIEYSWPLLLGLLLAAAENNGKLNVLDFGGSLGSTYFQNRLFLKELNEISWNIVEQANFVKIGRKNFQNDIIHFYDDAKECIKKENPKVLLLASVLQYIEKPFNLLDSILEHDFKYIIFDRTNITNSRERLTVQNVPPEIYKASYPCWFFNKEKLLNYFIDNNYTLIEEFNFVSGEKHEYHDLKGFIFRKKGGDN